MSEKSDGISFPDQPSITEESKGTPQFLTREDADSLKKDILTTIDETINRKTQSFSDKVSSRLEKSIADKLTSLKTTIDFQRSAGMEISPDVENALKQKVIADSYGQPLPPAEPTPALPTTNQQVSIAQYVDDTVVELEKTMGVGLVKSDPEAATLDSSSPQKFIATYTKALAAKKSRETPPPPAGSNVPIMGGGSNTGLAGQYQSELAKIKQGDVNALIDLKSKFRKQGLRLP
jgi:hypothetical protein